MYIFMPDWVNHSNQKKRNTPIYSLHVHPNGQKLATGGQDCKIKIWNTKCIRSPEKQGETSDPRLLSTLSLHNGAILCVKWSPDGRFLASGSDDTKVVIWTLDNSAYRNTGFGEASGAKNVETYRAMKVLVGHDSDVADVAWSPDQAYLASCGFDSKIFIWDANDFSLLKKIEKHTGFVKGLTWDPLGKYLSSQSDDKTTRVFRVSDWEQEKEISTPYTQAASTTFFRRPSWSPDGGCIATANGESGGIFVSAIVDRDEWATTVSLVGHEAPVEVSAFNPMLFEIKKPQKEVSAVCAIGSQDGGLSVWWTSQARAIAGARFLFTHSVLDLAWTHDGIGLFACSYDGSIAYLEFEASELGRVMSREEQERILSKYGLSQHRNMIPEGPQQIRLEKQLAAREAQSLSSVSDGSGPPDLLSSRMGSASVQSVQTVVAQPGSSDTIMRPAPQVSVPVPTIPRAQNVTLTKDGKKRIQPTFLQSPGGNALNSFQIDNTMVPPPPPTFSNLSIPAGNLSSVRATDEQASQLPPVQYILPAVQRSDSLKSLAVPAVRVSFFAELPAVESLDESNELLKIECRNETQGSKVVGVLKTVPVWQTKVSSAILLMAHSTKFIAVSCVDGSLHIMTRAGRLYFPRMNLPAVSSFLEAKDEFLSYLGSDGLLHVWNIIHQTILVDGANVLGLLGSSKDPKDAEKTIVSISLSSEGVPSISTSAFEIYAFHPQMKIWFLVSDRKNPKRDMTSQNPFLQSQTSFFKKLLKLEQIEEQLGRALIVRDVKEYTYWLLIYVRRLADENRIEKATEICQDLLSNETTVFSFVYTTQEERKAVLKDILPSLASNRGFQRLSSSCLDVLGDVAT